MSRNHPETAKGPVFHKVGQNLYRLESSQGYYALFKRRGKQIRKSLKTTDPALARRRLAELHQKVGRLTQTSGASKITFTELGARWLENARVKLKEKSATRLETCLKGLQPYFGDVPVRNITHRHCEEWLVKRGKEISPASYKKERSTLFAILDYALRDGLILDNPARASLPTRKIVKSKQVIPTRAQFRLLVESIRKSDGRAIPALNLVELLGYSGMRLNEAISLTWADVDLDRGAFTVTGGEQGTKNLEVRVVPLFPALRDLLERIRGDQEPPATDRVIPINCAQTAIINACKKASLPKFLHHSMRHYFCSNAIELGIDFKVIAGWLGHKDGGYLVAKTYGHLRDAHSFEMARRMTITAAETPPVNVVPMDIPSVV